MTDTPRHPSTPTIDRYLQFWNASPGDEQTRLATAVFAESVRYDAPIGQRRGITALVDLSAELRAHFEALEMSARHEPDVHHDHARLPWELHRDGAPFAAGTDILTFDGDGKVAAVVTFVDRAPDGFDPHAHQ